MADSADENTKHTDEQPVFDKLQELENILKDLSMLNEYGETGLETTSLTIPEVLNVYSEIIKIVVHKDGESSLIKIRKQGILKLFIYLFLHLQLLLIGTHCLRNILYETLA